MVFQVLQLAEEHQRENEARGCPIVKVIQRPHVDQLAADQYQV